MASWYGQKDVGLRLGTAFHRSHLEIVASQVSAITGAHATRWSKARRFGAAWALLKRLQPATTLRALTLPLSRASEAYERHKGSTLLMYLTTTLTTRPP